MNTQWMEDFLILWETRNFTAAARKANISQAAFSRRIHALETWLGQTLVDRSHHPIIFTPQGHMFHQEAAEMIRHLSQARVNLAAPHLGSRNHISILMPHVISSTRFVDWWTLWSRDTNLSVSAIVGNVADMIATFIAGGADMLICHSSGAFPMILNPDLYRSHTIEMDRFSPYRSATFKQDTTSRFPGTQAAPIPLANYTKGGYFSRLVDDIVSRAPVQLYGTQKVEADTVNLIKQFIANGNGVGWLPKCAISKEDLPQLRQIKQDGWSQDLPITAFIRSDANSAIADIVWEKLTERGKPNA
ncbi:MAG: LysR family transcriptional regulator [Rhizobiaceae bacterium]